MICDHKNIPQITQKIWRFDRQMEEFDLRGMKQLVFMGHKSVWTRMTHIIQELVAVNSSFAFEPIEGQKKKGKWKRSQEW